MNRFNILKSIDEIEDKLEALKYEVEMGLSGKIEEYSFGKKELLTAIMDSEIEKDLIYSFDMRPAPGYAGDPISWRNMLCPIIDHLSVTLSLRFEPASDLQYYIFGHPMSTIIINDVHWLGSDYGLMNKLNEYMVRSMSDVEFDKLYVLAYSKDTDDYKIGLIEIENNERFSY
jgi:hypothetical protein